MTNLIVLTENKNGYDPTEEEIVSYGQFLGLTFPEDDKFKPLLREALISPLPPGWEACEDEQQNLLYRNKQTQQIQQVHPLDGYYMQKINRLKNLTHNLPIETILQERDSWLKQSSDIFGPSRNSGDYSLKDQQFINQIQQQRSVFDEQEKQHAEIDNDKQPTKRIVIQKNAKTPRIYRRKKQSLKIEDIKQKLINFSYLPEFTKKDLELRKFPQFQSEQENKKLKQVLSLIQNIGNKKDRYSQLQRERKMKIQHLERLKNELKLMKG